MVTIGAVCEQHDSMIILLRYQSQQGARRLGLTLGLTLGLMRWRAAWKWQASILGLMYGVGPATKHMLACRRQTPTIVPKLATKPRKKAQNFQATDSKIALPM
jgi:hypothetical protein